MIHCFQELAHHQGLEKSKAKSSLVKLKSQSIEIKRARVTIDQSQLMKAREAHHRRNSQIIGTEGSQDNHLLDQNHCLQLG